MRDFDVFFDTLPLNAKVNIDNLHPYVLYDENRDMLAENGFTEKFEFDIGLDYSLKKTNKLKYGFDGGFKITFSDLITLSSKLNLTEIDSLLLEHPNPNSIAEVALRNVDVSLSDTGFKDIIYSGSTGEYEVTKNKVKSYAIAFVNNYFHLSADNGDNDIFVQFKEKVLNFLGSNTRLKVSTSNASPVSVSVLAQTFEAEKIGGVLSLLKVKTMN